MPESELVPTKDNFLARDRIAEMSAVLSGDVTTTPLLQYVYTKPLPDEADEDATLEYAAEVSGFLAGNADYKVGDCIGTVINARHFFMHRATVRETDDEGNWTGEYKETERVVIVEEDGTSYECQSDGVVASLMAIFQLPGIGLPTKWKKPLRMAIRQVTVRDKWRTFKLQVLGPNQAAPKPKPKKKESD